VVGIWTYIFVFALGDVSAYDEIQSYVLVLDPSALGTNSHNGQNVSACVASEYRTILIAPQTGWVLTFNVSEAWWGQLVFPSHRYTKKGRETFY
jgi:hypothetical protein